MLSEGVNAATQQRSRVERWTVVGIAAIVVFFVLSGLLAYSNTRTLNRNALLIAHTHEVLSTLDGLMALLKDAETGQRGYIITGEGGYLAPYEAATDAIERMRTRLATLVQDNPEHVAAMQVVTRHIDTKMAEMQRTITLRRVRGFEAARDVIETDEGREQMDALRSQIGAMQQAERTLRQELQYQMRKAYHLTVSSGIISSLLGVALALVLAILMRRAAESRRQQRWLQTGQMELGRAMLGEQRTEQLGENMLRFLAPYVGAQAGVVYVKENGHYRRAASYGVAEDGHTPETFAPGSGLLGQAVADQRIITLSDVPEDYLTIGSALGQGVPRHLMIAPAVVDGMVFAVIELGSMQPFGALTHALMDEASDAVAVAVRTAGYRSHLQNLLQETQRQAEELQAQSEELRVSNEELEEQGRALKASQANLELQQAELEQTNAQLEEQTQMLEAQKQDLEVTQQQVQQKADELERSSQYKSDFLANMSHELRTPLNSSLILAKLLADNEEGNLTDEQVKYAQTIHSAGHDLLALINDILDLSKIEAGHMDMKPESIAVSRMLKGIERVFEPLAKQKGLVLRFTQGKEVTHLFSDTQRLEQVLKNLLSNALKFTETGEVSLSVRKEGDQIAFAVRDTGIGISQEQQAAVFDAFRQADGTISRKYGGTGLGLSISRQLARLLGGRITLESTVGEGSLFTLFVPESYAGEAVAKLTPIEEMPQATPPDTLPQPIEDDRDDWMPHKRSLLVIEDDESFARILYDLAHELGFLCLIATTAEAGIAMAKAYPPSAMVLDIGLPDHSGLTVLDRLKRDATTRHIPVHVVSANDYVQTALSLGAIGYMLKPVKREALAEALRQMESHIDRQLRRVLIVEDDEVQRASICKLLASPNVETVAVGTAAECIARLKDETFDCMVLDLSLPDASGYSLLETLGAEEGHAFPPVIVYTARDLTAKEEQRIQKYSQSIIIKGAKSPERLLDEVTLFLHQVVAELRPDQQRMLAKAKSRDAVLEGKRILVVEDDVRNVYALSNILEPKGAKVEIARNGREALDMLDRSILEPGKRIDLVLMDVMMPVMDGLAATREIRSRDEWKRLPIIMLTAKAMRDDQERCIEAGANDYMAKPLDVEKLLSLVRVWMPR